jgi:hypothetical protein
MTLTNTLTRPPWIIALLILQIAPLLLFPASSFAPTTQEWWLPLLLTLLVIVADIQIIFRRNSAQWPWTLIIFAQGFNIISRLMMLWSHATVTSGNQTSLNWSYLIPTLVAMGLSAFFLWYFEKPAVRVGLLR